MTSVPPRIARALLETPLMSEGHEDFRETWKWRRELRKVFSDLTGWTVQISPGVLRLCGQAPFPDAGRAGSEELDSPRAASMFAWTLWYHESLGRVSELHQFTLEELAGAITQASGTDFLKSTDRQALTRALKALTALGAVQLIDAGDDAWLEGRGPEGQAPLPGTVGGKLFEFTVLAAYLISPAPPDSPTDLQRAYRALLTGPALSRARDPQAYLALDATACRQIESVFGWSTDQQGDYAALLRDAQPRRSAHHVPQGRSAGSAAALLLTEAVRAEQATGRLGRDTQGRVLISGGELYGLMDTVREQYRAHWGQFGLKSTETLLGETLDRWRALGALSDWPGSPDGYALEPHLARVRAAYPDPQPSEKRSRTTATNATPGLFSNDLT